ncbi:MAG: hypothetical protein KI785_02755 [Devosiaceae bacterium]|nr:hypothetical protein [Devosiaceae bacterium MH13]
MMTHRFYKKLKWLKHCGSLLSTDRVKPLAFSGLRCGRRARRNKIARRPTSHGAKGKANRQTTGCHANETACPEACQKVFLCVGAKQRLNLLRLNLRWKGSCDHRGRRRHLADR